MRRPRLLPLVLILLTGCGEEAQPPRAATEPPPATAVSDPGGGERRYLLETVDDAAVVQLYADGFERLSLREKTLAYHLTQAALAGRDIFYDQKHREALAMRELLEAIVAHRDAIEPATYAAVHQYTKLFWINNGPYNSLTARKFVLPVTPAAFAAAAHAAVAAGARLSLAPGETLDTRLARLEPMFFDPAFEPLVTSKGEEDILAGSANNLYAGVRASDLAGFRERAPLNSRLVRRDGRLVEEVYRIGGRYSRQITAIVGHLEEAIPFAPEATARALRELIRWYRTGDDAARVAYDIAWVEDREATVDTINGFIEVYLDPRGVKGAYEGIVFYVNQEKTERIRAFAREAQWFEDRMPFDPRFRKPAVTGIVANAIDVVIETGDAGPLTPVGINLPNDQQIRERHGSKSVSLANVVEAYERSSPDAVRDEFSWSPEESARAEAYGALADELLTDMHEVIGHASGQQAPGARRVPVDALREHASALEEARADLVGLYFTPDPKLVALGAVPASGHADLVRTQYESYARNALVQLRRVRTGTQIEDDHMRNRQMIVEWLLANTRAIERRRREGRTFYVVVDIEAFRTGVGRLLAEVQRIKSEGDYRAAKALFDRYGINFDPALRDEVVARVAPLKLPSYTGFVMPTLEAVRDERGTITAVTISYPLDLTRQMLAFSAAAP